MATSRPFAYNIGSSIPGTEQIGNIAVGYPTDGFTSTGLDWWNGPDEELGYVVCGTLVSSTQETPVPEDNLYLDSLYKGVDVNLSNNNQTAYQQFGYQQSVLGTTLISGTDKVMFRVSVYLANPAALPGSHVIGIGYTTMNYQGNPYGGYPGNDTNSTGFSSDGSLYYNGSVISDGLPTWGNGDIVDIAISHGQYLWIRVNGGNWNNSETANPSTPSGGLTLSGLSNFYPVLCPGYEGTMTILNFANGLPSGYNFLGNKTASLGFFRSEFSDSAFMNMAASISGQSYNSPGEYKTWLITNGYWTSYGLFSSSLTILTNDGGGLNGWNSTAFAIAPNPEIGTTYPVGSQIIFQNGEMRTIVGIDDYSPLYIDIFYDSPISSSTLFPITIVVL